MQKHCPAKEFRRARRGAPTLLTNKKKPPDCSGGFVLRFENRKSEIENQ